MDQESSRAMREAEAAASGHFDDFVSSLASRIGMRASASAVFGDAVTRDEVTVIPVAKVRWGFGGGAGSDGGRDKDGNRATEEGSGGGGGVMASPLGYIEIRDGEAVFRRIKDVSAYVPIILASTFAAAVSLWSLKRLFR